jgi:UDP-glucose 4-epimerase
MTESTVIVTGGAGYVGSHVALAFLEAGYQVVVLDDLSTGFARLVPAAARLVQGDAGDAALVGALARETGASALVHLAGSVVVAESFADPARYWRNNAIASLTLFDAALEAGIGRIVFSSTAAVYGEASAPVGEDGPLQPASPYGRSKLAAEVMLKDLAATRGARYATLRYFNVAGADPGGRAGQLSPSSGHLIKAACEVAGGKRPALQIFGTDYPTRDGTCVRDYIHVSDLADLHVLALQRLEAGGGSFTGNCGYGEGATVREAVSALERVIGRPLPTEAEARRPGDQPSVVADSRYVRTLLDWRPRFASLETILETAWRWEQGG